MNRIQTTFHNNHRIILIDLSNTKPAETIACLPKAQELIAQQLPKSALVLTDVSGAVYDKEVATAMKAFTQHNTPYMKASAVVGAQGVQLVLLQTIIFLTRRELKTFNDRPSALAWLASH